MIRQMKFLILLSLVLCIGASVSLGSRKFLTGLIIGTLLGEYHMITLSIKVAQSNLQDGS